MKHRSVLKRKEWNCTDNLQSFHGIPSACKTLDNRIVFPGSLDTRATHSSPLVAELVQTPTTLKTLTASLVSEPLQPLYSIYYKKERNKIILIRLIITNHAALKIVIQIDFELIDFLECLTNSKSVSFRCCISSVSSVSYATFRVLINQT